MKRPYPFALLASLVTSLLVQPDSAQALVAAPTELIKGSGSAVYYYSSNGKRYVFPTEKTYFTWYSDFSRVTTISDAQLAALPIGGNVTYKPGVKLIKITTDPRVYAIDTNGTLRHIDSESIATGLYGSDWSKKIDDLPDAFFVNYKLGSKIASISEFSPATITAKAVSIDVDKGFVQTTQQPIPTPIPVPTPSPTPTTTIETASSTSLGTLALTKSSAKILEKYQILASALTGKGVTTIELRINGILTKSCEYSPCTIEEQVPRDAVSPINVSATFKTLQGASSTQILPLTIMPGVAGVTFSLTKSTIKPNTIREAIVQLDSSIIGSSLIEIYLDGGLVKICSAATECRYTEIESAPIGTVHSYQAKVTRPSGEWFQSETKQQTVVTNESPIITTNIASTFIALEQQGIISTQASDDDGISQIQYLQGSTALKTCASASCELILGPYPQPTTLDITVKAVDLAGNSTVSVPYHFIIQ